MLSPASPPFLAGPLPEQLRHVHEHGVWEGLRCEGEYAVVRYRLATGFADLYYSRHAITPAFLCTSAAPPAQRGPGGSMTPPE